MIGVKNMGREQFTFYRSYYDAVMKLQPSRRYKLFMAIVEYALDKVQPVGLDRGQEMAFLLVRPVLDAAWKRSKSGATGGKISRRGPAEKISKKEKEEEIENEIETESEGFLRFWQRYPVKLGRQEALAQWEPVCEEQDRILEGLELWRNSQQWKRENGRFIPKPEKWLKERWWRQSPKQVLPMGASGHLGKAELEAIEEVMKEDL